MTEGKTTGRRFKALLLLLLGFGVVAVGLFGVYRIATGQSIGLRSGLSDLLDDARAMADSQTVTAASTGQYTNIIFLHHSTGRNLIEQGHLRELLTGRGYQFWDQDYNDIGLRRPDGQPAGYAFNVPDDNTDPGGLAVVFAQREQSRPVNTLSGLLQYEVIVFKSCFPNSNIDIPEQLTRLKEIYTGIRDTIDRHPQKVFVLLTTPPLNPAETNVENARRARELANWLVSSDYTMGRRNLFVFDFYNTLAEPDDDSAQANMLKAAYRDGSDSHPNQKANETVAPALADFISSAVGQYRAD